nr:radical SAM protein [bacterium]
LAYIAGRLDKEKIGFNIIDREMLLHKKYRFDLKKLDDFFLDKIKDDKYIGFSMASPNFEDVERCAKQIKIKYPEKKIVLGGPHPSLLPTETMEKIAEVDYIVRGEGEETIFELLKENCIINQIKGLTYREGNEIKHNPDREQIENIDLLPLPLWKSLDMEYYTREGNVVIRFLNLRAAHIFGSRGCPFKCDFCAGPKIFPKLRFHSPDRIIEEIKTLERDYKINGLYFADDQFLAVENRAAQICEKLIESGLHKKIKWCVQARAKAVNNEILSLMKKAGCVQIEFGFESGSQKMLNSISKKANVEDYYRAAELTKKAGLRILANIIVGLPCETENDFYQTSDFMLKIRPNVFGFNVLMPLAGTNIFEKYIKDKADFDYNAVDCFSAKFNITAMGNDVFEKLYLKVRREIVFPTYAWDYIKYNLFSDPKWAIIYLYRLFKLIINKPKVFINFFILRKNKMDRF